MHTMGPVTTHMRRNLIPSSPLLVSCLRGTIFPWTDVVVCGLGRTRDQPSPPKFAMYGFPCKPATLTEP